MVTGGESRVGVSQHPCQYRQHLAEVAEVLHIEAGPYRVRSGGEGNQQIANPLEVNHAFQASQFFADLLD